MIKSGLVALAVIGCDCDAKTCEYIRTTDAQWSSVADCEADARAGILLQHENYPLVVAVCRDTAEGAGRMAALPQAPNAFTGPTPTSNAAIATGAPASVTATSPTVPALSATPAVPSTAAAPAPSVAPAPPAPEIPRTTTWRDSAVAAASAIVAPLLASASTGSSTTDGAGRVTTLFRTESGLVSIRGTVGGALASASRTALDTVGWLRAAITPQWF